MKAKFSSVYHPERDMAIDEFLLLWKADWDGNNTSPRKERDLGLSSLKSVSLLQDIYGTSLFTLKKIPSTIQI